MIIGLFVIMLCVLILPFIIKFVEEQLELFLFIMGVIAVTITNQWGGDLIKEALKEPLKITAAVFLAGVIFRNLQKTISRNISSVINKLGLKTFIFLTVALLGCYQA